MVNKNLKDKNIVVLVGGPSQEAEVSRRTGGAICKTLQEAGYKATLLELNGKTLCDDLKGLECEIVFNALHGKYGEDGAVQGMLELLQIPYTGSGIMASAIGMNKKISKDLFVGAGIPTSQSQSFDVKEESKEEILASIKATFSYPFVIKAASQGGSSIGVSIVKEESQLEAALKEILSIDHSCIVERFLAGDEFTVSILNGKAMPVIMIKPHSGNYDYSSKYTKGATEYLVPAPISEELTKEMQRISVAAYKVLNCSGVARVDVMTDHEGKPHVLEVNTIPGMTETSLVPKSANALGMSFLELCEEILATAGIDKW